MESKSIKKSTMSQLQALVEYMEANPDFARGRVVFGSSKMSVEEQWNTLTKNLNSFGPPMRSVADWKKSWADLKSRTKKKIAENKRSLTETGGGLFRNNPLTELEQLVDRTLFLSKAAAPSGNVFGFSNKNSSEATAPIDDCFVSLKPTPPRIFKAVAAVTPSRQQQTSNKQPSTEIHKETDTVQLLQHQDRTFPAPNKHTGVATPSRRIEAFNQEPSNNYNYCHQQKQKRQLDIGDEPSSSKKRKTVVDEQLNIIRRQLKVGEQSAALAKDQVDVTKTLVEATKTLATAAQRMADAGEQQAKTSAKIAKTFELLVQHLMEK